MITFTTRLFSVVFSSAFICYSISKNPRLSMEQPLQFRILYTNCLWSSNLFWLIQTHGTKTRHRYTHNSCTYLEISWFSIGRMEEARSHMPYTQTHTCITVVLYLDIIQKSHVYDLCGCFFFNVWTYHPYLEDYLVDQHSSGGLKPPSTCTSAPLSSRPLVGPHTHTHTTSTI